METERIEERSEELIINALDFIEKSAGFVAEQAPLVVQEFLLYRTVVCASLSLGALIFMVVYFFVLMKAIGIDGQEASKKLTTREEFTLAAAFFGAIPGLISIPVFIVNTIILVKILIAPRVYLIEELPKLISGGGC